MVNLIMNEIMDHGPRVSFDDIGPSAFTFYHFQCSLQLSERTQKFEKKFYDNLHATTRITVITVMT